MALTLGAPPDGPTAQRVADNLARDVAAFGNKTTTGVVGIAFLFQALDKYGHGDAALSVLLNDGCETPRAPAPGETPTRQTHSSPLALPSNSTPHSTPPRPLSRRLRLIPIDTSHLCICVRHDSVTIAFPISKFLADTPLPRALPARALRSRLPIPAQDPSLGHMAHQNMTTLCENFACTAHDAGGGSQNHIMLGGFDAWLTASVGGLDATTGNGMFLGLCFTSPTFLPPLLS